MTTTLAPRLFTRPLRSDDETVIRLTPFEFAETNSGPQLAPVTGQTAIGSPGTFSIRPTTYPATQIGD